MGRYNKDVTITLSTKSAQALAALDNIAKKTDKLGRQFTNIGIGLQSIFNPAFDAMMTGITAAGAAMTGLGVAALSVGGSFEKQMSLVQGVAGASAKELQAMSDKAKELGATLPVSASDAARAMYDLASAGMSVSQILASIDDVVNISIAQNYDLEASAALVVTTLKGFKLETSDANKVVDVFSNGISNSMLTMGKLGEAMRMVAPLANSLGMSLEDTVAAMEVLSNTGLEGSQIGTSLRRVLSALHDPSPEAAEIFKTLGVEISDDSDKVRKFSEIMRDFKSSGLTAEQALAAFGDRGAIAAIALADAADSLDLLEKELKRYGRTQEQVNLQQKTFENKIKSLKSAIEADLLVMFDQIHEKAGDYVDDLTEMARAAGDWVDKTDAIDQVLSGFLEGLGLGTPNIESFKESLEGLDPEAIAQKFEKLGEGIRALFRAFKNLADAVPWQFLADHLRTIINIIAVGWVAGKITAVGGAITVLTKALTALAGAAKTVDAVIGGSTVLSALLGSGTAAGGMLGAGGVAAGGMLATGGIAAVAYELANAKKTQEPDESTDLLKKAASWNKKAFDQLNPTEQEWIVLTNTQITDLAEKIKSKATEVEKILADMRKKTGKDLDVSEMQKKITDWLKADYSSEITDLYSSFGQKGLDALLGRFKKLPERMRDLLSQSFMEMYKSVNPEIDKLDIDDQVTSVAGKMETVVELMPDKLKKITTSAVNQLKGDFSSEIISVYSKLGEKGFAALIKQFANLPDETKSLLTQAVTEVQDSINNQITDLAENMDTLAESMQKTIRPDGFMQSISQMTSQLKGNFSTEIISIYSKLGQKGLDALLEQFKTLPEKTKEILTKAVTEVQASMKDTNKGTGQTKQTADKLTTSLGSALLDFAKYTAQARANAVKAVREFGVDADEAGDTFKTAVLDKAEDTAKNLVKTFNDPQMRNNFINSLRSLGEKGGNKLYEAVADAMDKADNLTGNSKIASDTLKSYGIKDSIKGWNVEVVKDTQAQTLYKVTKGTQDLFHTVMKGKNDLSGYDWTKALNIDGIKSALDNGLNGVATLAGTQGDTIGVQLETGIRKHIDSVVAYAKKQLKTISVSTSTKNTSSSSGSSSVSEEKMQDLHIDTD